MTGKPSKEQMMVRGAMSQFPGTEPEGAGMEGLAALGSGEKVVGMNEQPKLGQLLEGHCGRDAVHVAIAPVVAKYYLPPGQHVGFVEEGNTELVGVLSRSKCVGIIDPFLVEVVDPGQRCWLFLYPNTVTSLRHVWRHPAFEAAAAKRLEALNAR